MLFKILQKFSIRKIANFLKQFKTKLKLQVKKIKHYLIA